MSDRSALELAENSRWGMLYQMISSDPTRAEECDDFGMMPLHWACTAREVEPRVVRKLLDAYPTAAMLKNKGGLIPLHIAIKAKASLEVLQVLVTKNDDAVCEETSAGETASELAELCKLSPRAMAYLTRVEEDLRLAGRMAPRPPRIRPLSSHASLRGFTINDELSTRSSEVGIKRQDISMLRARGSAPHGHTLPPRWQMDKKCNVCHLKFTYFKNRHHCRNCGVSVCSTHSSKRLPLQHIGLDTPQRVCIMCYDDLRENGKPPSAVANLYSKRQDDESSGSSRGRKPFGDVSNNMHQRSSLTNSQARTYIESSIASQHDFNDSDDDDDDDLLALHDSAHHIKLPSRARPRAQTDNDAGERISAMKSQVKELEGHMRELLDQKERMQSAIELSNRKVEHAIKEKHIHESTVDATRGESIIDVTRITDNEELERKVQNISLSVDDAVANPDDLEMPDDATLNVAATCHYLGLALFEKGDFADAVQELRKSVALNRRDGDTWYDLARALQAENEPFEAEIAIKRALNLDPKNYAAMSLLGKILHARGDHDQSIEVFQRALGLMTAGSDSGDEEDVGSLTVGW